MRNEKKRSHVQEFDVVADRERESKDMAKCSSSRLFDKKGQTSANLVDYAVVHVS